MVLGGGHSGWEGGVTSRQVHVHKDNDEVKGHMGDAEVGGEHDYSGCERWNSEHEEEENICGEENVYGNHEFS